jgi:hypothetical protein
MPLEVSTPLQQLGRSARLVPGASSVFDLF